jgi:hypothetical protein
MKEDGDGDPADCDCEVNPYHMCCLAVHFSSVVDNAAERLEQNDKIALSQAGRRQLYQYGKRHLDAFSTMLKTNAGHDRLVGRLHRHLLDVGVDRGSEASRLNPPQVDTVALERSLAAGHWRPD